MFCIFDENDNMLFGLIKDRKPAKTKNGFKELAEIEKNLHTLQKKKLVKINPHKAEAYINPYLWENQGDKFIRNWCFKLVLYCSLRNKGRNISSISVFNLLTKEKMAIYNAEADELQLIANDNKGSI